MKHHLLLPPIITLLLALTSHGATAKADAKAAANVTFQQLSLEDFSQQLQAHVNDGRVDYGKFSGNAAQDHFVEQIGRFDLDSTADNREKLVFYINAYNALAIQGILNGRSPKSFFGKVGFFYNEKFLVAGKKINLYDLEHEYIRKLDEPRIHFALVCAAQSCPKLRSEAYAVDNLSRQFDENARDFINDPSKNRFDKTGKVAHLSKIFKWFEEDFTATGKTLQEYIAPYVADEQVAAELAANNYKIKYMKYDWQLNGSK